MDLLALRADHRGRLRTFDAWPLRLARRPIGQIAGQAFEAVAVIEALSIAGDVRAFEADALFQASEEIDAVAVEMVGKREMATGNKMRTGACSPDTNGASGLLLHTDARGAPVVLEYSL